jgi:hypothetical protein
MAAEPNEMTEQSTELDDGQPDTVSPDPLPAPSKRRGRSDRGRLHATRHNMLSRPLLEALSRLGESARALRSLERDFRKALKPNGVVANVMFDRMWLSYLRLLLIARTEANVVTPAEASPERERSTATILEKDVPILVLAGRSDGPRISQPFLAQLEQNLTAIGKYDKHVAREFFRALAFLLLLRDGGESNLAAAIKNMTGLGREPHG